MIGSVLVATMWVALQGAGAAAAPLPRATTVRFIAVGDGGKGDEPTHLVAEAAKRACAARGGCGFVVLLGDNVYPRGPRSKDDPQLKAKIEDVWSRLGVPIYAVLGNHDYGAPDELPFFGGIGFDPRRAAAERAYPWSSFRMYGPAARLDVGPVELELIDTVPIYWRDGGLDDLLDLDDEGDAIERAMRKHDLERRAPWRIAVGHHPYRSNGVHGDAGAYEGIGWGLPGSGAHLKEFFQLHVVGRYDALITGHDHDLFDMGDEQGTSLFVVGGGSEHRPITQDRPVPWQSASLGFMLVEADARTLSFTMYTVDDAPGPGGAPTFRSVHARAKELR